MCLRRLLASCSATNLCNLFTSLQPVFSPCNEGLHPSLPGLILVRPCEALNQYSVYCLTYSLKKIFYINIALLELNGPEALHELC